MPGYGAVTEAKISEVLEACRSYGSNSIVALAGVPGTGKSYIASIAAQRLAGEPLLVREIQFHPSFSYEEFIEGYRAQRGGGFAVEKGVFLDLNDVAAADPGRTYVVLIEEFTRANLPSVLGELLTYVEYRDRPFFTIYTRRPVKVAPNLMILATYNPRDRSALELDEAIIRRLRIIRFEASEEQLEEMLRRSLGIPDGQATPGWLGRLKELFKACRATYGRDFEALMPFGHGMFASVKTERPDLHLLWTQRIEPMIRRPLLQPHPFADTVEQNYPWRDANYQTS
jgi:5-methylcytosine-specific restriction protein B